MIGNTGTNLFTPVANKLLDGTPEFIHVKISRLVSILLLRWRAFMRVPGFVRVSIAWLVVKMTMSM